MKRYYTIALAVALLLACLAFVWRQLTPSETPIAASPEEVAEAQQEQAEAYENSLPAVLQEFAENYRAADDNGKKQQALIYRDKILALIVPVKYKDLHLGLVLALSELGRGEKGGEQKFSEAVTPHSWLSTISLSK
jgi:hypothetical protein